MTNTPSPPSGDRRNGHPTVGSKGTAESAPNEELEPKGYPTSDRYRAETAHATETDNNAGKKKQGKK
jgi:hypothetical protein